MSRLKSIRRDAGALDAEFCIALAYSKTNAATQNADATKETSHLSFCLHRIASWPTVIETFRNIVASFRFQMNRLPKGTISGRIPHRQAHPFFSGCIEGNPKPTRAKRWLIGRRYQLTIGLV